MAKHVSLERVRRALEGLRGGYPPALLAFLAMKKAGVNYDTWTEYGSVQENQLLDAYFRPERGAPTGKRYFIPLGRSGWVDERYSGSTLQRARTSKNSAGTVFANGVERNGRSFKFAPDVTARLMASFPRAPDGGRTKLNALDLIAWMRRNDTFDDAKTPQALVEEFRTEFRLAATEFDAVFDAPDETSESFFAAEAIANEELTRLIGGRLASVVLGGREGELIEHLVTFLEEQERFILPVGFVRRFFSALKAQGFVILCGKPGTGKSQFVQAFLRGLMDFFQTNAIVQVFQAVSPEHSESDVLGYENLEGRHVGTEFVRQVFDSDLARERRGVFFLVLDEFNLAQADRYLARVLPGVESDQKVALPGRDASYLPPDTFVVGTANSYLEESSRLPLSGPVLRRAHLIEMPNALSELLSEGEAEQQFLQALVSLTRQSAERIADRSSTRGESFLDEDRKARLQAFIDDTDTIAPPIRTILFDIARGLAEDPTTALTFGVLQDVADYILMSSPSMATLDEALIQKVLPQLRGPVTVAESLHESLADRANDIPRTLAYLTRLIERADTVSGEIQPLA